MEEKGMAQYVENQEISNAGSNASLQAGPVIQDENGIYRQVFYISLGSNNSEESSGTHVPIAVPLSSPDNVSNDSRGGILVSNPEDRPIQTTAASEEILQSILGQLNLLQSSEPRPDEQEDIQEEKKTATRDNISELLPARTDDDDDDDDSSKLMKYDQMNGVTKLDEVFTMVTTSLTDSIRGIIPGASSVYLQKLSNQDDLNLTIQDKDDKLQISGKPSDVFLLGQKLLNLNSDSELPGNNMSAAENTQKDPHAMQAIRSKSEQKTKKSRFGRKIKLRKLDDEFRDDEGQTEGQTEDMNRKASKKALAGQSSPHPDEQSSPHPAGQLDRDVQLNSNEGGTVKESKQNDFAEAFSYVTDKKPKSNTVRAKDRGGMSYHCDICSFKTRRQSHLAKHSRIHQRNPNLFKCSQCDFRTIQLNHLKRHEQTHLDVLQQCPHCVYQTAEEKTLQKHIRLKHGKAKEEKYKVFRCPICDFETTKTFHFRRHFQRHATKPLSDKDLGNLSMLTEKGLPVSLVSNYKCDQCQYSTRVKDHFLRHQRQVHSNLKPHLCDLCGRGFKRIDGLQQHKQIHLDRDKRKLPFSCPECEKSFRSKAHLTEHMSIHSLEKPYLCEICGSGFKTRGSQRKHIISIHVNPRQYTCKFCAKKFNTPFALQRHVRTHDTTGLPYQGITLQETQAAQEFFKNENQSPAVTVQKNEEASGTYFEQGEAATSTEESIKTGEEVPNVLQELALSGVKAGTDGVPSGVILMQDDTAAEQESGKANTLVVPSVVAEVAQQEGNSDNTIGNMEQILMPTSTGHAVIYLNSVQLEKVEWSFS